MKKSRALFLFQILLGLVPCLFVSVISGADPIPAINRILPASVFTKSGSTATMRSSDTTHPGYMTAAQASDLAFVLAGGLPTPVTSPFPPLTFPDGISIREIGASTVLVTDAFTGANTSNINGRTTTTGSKTWTTPKGGGTGTWGITSNRATTSLASGSTNAELDTGAIDGVASVTVVSKGTGVTNQGILFRCTSGGDCLWFGFYNGACWGIGHSTGTGVGDGTVWTGDGCVTPLTNGDVLAVTYSGNVISATLNGSAFLTTTQSQNNTETRGGISTGGGSVSVQFDSYSVSTVAVPTALVIDVPLGGGGVQIPSQLILSSSLTVAGTMTGSGGYRVARTIPFTNSGPSFSATPTLGMCVEGSGSGTATGAVTTDACVLDGASSVGVGFFDYSCRVQASNVVLITRCCINAAIGCAAPAGEPTSFSGYVLKR